jgi:hypothetical protein
MLQQGQFVGGQDNLKAVVKAAELAGESEGGALLWVHGPQPVINQEIYIMAPYVSTPAFYELTLGSGETDSYEFFKNHPEIGPFLQVPQTTPQIAGQLTAFFAKWKADCDGYVVKLTETTNAPAGTFTLSDPKASKRLAAHPGEYCGLSDQEAHEVLTLNANRQCGDLIASRHSHIAASLAVSYGFVSPVSSAVVTNVGQPDADTAEPATEIDEAPAPAEDAASAPKLQGATNGTIGAPANDATVISGVNTAGTVRVNNLANLEAMLNIIANLAEIGSLIGGAMLILFGLSRGGTVVELMGHEIELTPMKLMGIGLLVALIGLSVPGVINWFVASARDANLFS